MKAIISRLMLLVIALSVGSLPIAACSTMHGAGQDIEKAGSKLSNEAREHQHY